MSDSVREAKARAHHGPPDVIIGKSGVTEAVLREIDRRLEQKGVVKVKMLRTAVRPGSKERKLVAAMVAERLGARLLGVRGRTFVLHRQGKRRVKDKRLS
ncbi:MAG: YhbY family RNA-binding protein [Aeropyrum sp.]|nr:YhbY family RNA-binding protein [Aeropyrum sp.]MCE4616056.1 YhbY family RNA-binding protein [Aeropyrum sp.]